MADTSLTKRALTGAGWLIGWRMVSRTLGFLSTLVLARLLVPADFGVVSGSGPLIRKSSIVTEFGHRR